MFKISSSVKRSSLSKNGRETRVRDLLEEASNISKVEIRPLTGNLVLRPVDFSFVFRMCRVISYAKSRIVGRA